MGVVYKLNPGVKDYIISAKKKDSRLSCRKLSALTTKKFKFEISKSAINSLIKAQGLSMPVGRRRKVRRGAVELEGAGAIMLKAADWALGGTHYIAEAIQGKLGWPPSSLSAKTEALLYSANLPVDFDKNRIKSSWWLWPFVNQVFPAQDLATYRAEINKHPAIPSDISRILTNAFEEVRCIKVNLSSGNAFFLDGQMHTVWSTLNMPCDFALPLFSVKEDIKKYFRDNRPLVIFAAPGYDMPTREFFDFMLNLDSLESKISKLTLFDNKLQEIESIDVEKGTRRFFVFGLWPWQFKQYRKVTVKEEFKPFSFPLYPNNLYIAEVETELLHPGSNAKIALRGYALKASPDDKIRVIILSNLPSQDIQSLDLCGIYLKRWPNLEESFQDYSRKIELFTYTAASQNFFSVESLPEERPSDIDSALSYYLKVLDLYARLHFFPFGYEKKDFQVMKQSFYDLNAKLKKQKDYLLLTFRPPLGYAFTKDLEYAIRRVNERGVVLASGERLWLGL